MPVTLPTQNLGSLAVGQTGTIDLTTLFGGTSVTSTLATLKGQYGVLRLHNDSGSGLQVVIQPSGQQFYLPAGGWQDCYPRSGDTTLAYTVIYVLPDPPVTLLLATYYYPTETAPAITVLGNSPVGIGGTVSTSVNTLSNEGKATGTLVIDIGDVNFSELVKFFTDSFSLSVDQSGVAHFVLRGQTSGNAVLIGQTGDTSEIAGNLAVVGTTSLDNANITTDGNGNVTLAGTINGGLYVDTGATPGSSNIRMGTSAANAGNLIDNPAGTNQSIYFKNPNAGNGSFIYQAPNGTTRWSLGAINTGTFGASGTYNHGLGGTPAAVLLCPDAGSSTTTFGATSYTSTQFSATLFNAMTTRWWAYR